MRGRRATYRGVFGTMLTIVRTEGAGGLYNGLLAGLHRQMSFASVRVGLYDATKQFYAGGSESKRKRRPGATLRLRVDSKTAQSVVLDNLLYVNRLRKGVAMATACCQVRPARQLPLKKACATHISLRKNEGDWHFRSFKYIIIGSKWGQESFFWS